MTVIDLSVVLTTCDRPTLVGRALSSCLAQEDVTVEVVVVDDGVAAPFEQPAQPGRVRVLRTGGRIGGPSARNAGLAEARGEWVTFLDDDDELLPGFARESLTAVTAARLPTCHAVVSGMEERDEHGTVLAVRRPRPSPLGARYTLDELDPRARFDMQAFNTLVVRRSLLAALGGWDEALPVGEHTDLFARLNGVSSIASSDTVGYVMHHHGAPRSRDDYTRRARAMLQTYTKHDALFRQRRARAAQYVGDAGWYFHLGGAWSAAVGCALRSLALDARRVKGYRDLLAMLAGRRSVSLARRLVDSP